MPPWIGIAIGDVTGIGPEVALKALAGELATDETRYLLLGDAGHLERTNRQLGLSLPLEPFDGYERAGRLFHHPASTPPLSVSPAPGSAAAANAAMDWLAEGARRCLAGELQALVTAPVNKEAILRAGHKGFVGQTEFLSQLAGTRRTAMMLLGRDDRDRWLRVALATTHLPLRRVADSLTQEGVELAVELAARACVDLGLSRSRVGVCGLNPHAGEGGHLGSEEQSIITPAVEAARSRGCDAVGPLPADALFYHAFRGDYDAVVAMYHDQGLGPLKMIGFETGVNWTLGLPFIRTSPDHGTAYDIAGRNLASPTSMVAALRLARQLADRRRRPGDL